jgi:thioredoxin-like negative regulator of GroEL
MRPLLLLVLAALLVSTQAVIHHLTDKNFHAKVNEAPFTLVYFYSSSCKFCKEFTPVFEKLSKNK